MKSRQPAKTKSQAKARGTRPTCLFLSTYFPPMIGGSIVYYRYLLSKCTADDVVVLSLAHEGSAAFDASAPYRIIRSRLLPCFGIQSRLRKLVGALAMFPILLFWVLRYRAPVLHLGNFSPDILAGWPIARLMGRRLVVTILGEELTTVGGLWSVFRPLRVLGDWAAYWMLRHCAVVQTISGFTRSELLRRGIREDRIAVITPGIDLDKSRCDRPIAAEIAARLAGKRIVLTVGRFTARKGQDMTIRALPRVLSSHPDVVYVMAGSACYENCQECARLIEERNLQGSAVLLKDLDSDSIAWLYQNCEVFIMANRTLANNDTEGYGIVFLEAGAWGKPVVGGRAGGATDAVDDGVTGILVDGTSEESIADALNRLLSDKELARRMGEAGRRKVAQNSWDAKCDQYLGLIGALAHPEKTR
ncbi:MAG: glycosyltransferase family 4 protein [Thermoguttaceae bacterium]